MPHSYNLFMEAVPGSVQPLLKLLKTLSQCSLSGLNGVTTFPQGSGAKMSD